MRRRALLAGMTATALAAALAAAGCSLLPSQPYLQRRDWPLVVRRPPVPRGQRDSRVLLVRTVRAGPGLETRGLQTLQQDGSLQSGFYEQWSVPPAEAVDDDLRRWLADSGRFAAVVAPGSRMTAELVLESELVSLHADLGNSTARAALALVLIDQQVTPARIRLETTVSASVQLEGTDPPAVVRAQLAAVAAVLSQTEDDLANALRP